ncbi:MAG: YicC/YloC family endoribonuclease, partial [Pseudohongiellaceae bacterium]
MMLSMTAFSRQQLEGDWGALTWEIRSVNHRYLESSVRLPEPFRSLEAKVRDRLRKKLARGKVECQLRYQAVAPEQSELQLNDALIERLLDANKEISARLGGPTDLNGIDILRWPGVIKDETADSSALESEALKLFDQALDELIANRQREGDAIKAMLEQRISAIRDIVVAVRKKMPDILAAQRQTMLDKINELKAELEASRIDQEVALLAQKADVAEELDRLDSHLEECARVLDTKGPKGRRLDFLMQELNREANTLSSKSLVADTTLSAVELKVLIEQ